MAQIYIFSDGAPNKLNEWVVGLVFYFYFTFYFPQEIKEGGGINNK